MGLMIGDYVSYMAPTTKDLRREQWKGWNFAGTVDWAVDLQSFTADDMDAPPGRPQSGEGCVSGEDDSVNTADLCEFSCGLGFCPESLCTCVTTGQLRDLPHEKPGTNVIAWDEHDVDLNRLCKFACKYGYCPDDVCTTPPVASDDSDNSHGDDNGSFPQNNGIQPHETDDGCPIYREQQYAQLSRDICKEPCRDINEEAQREGRTTNYGCVGFWPLDQPIPWQTPPGQPTQAVGRCLCDNQLINDIADDVLEALPVIAEVFRRVSTAQEGYLTDHARLAAMPSCHPSSSYSM
jgi:hypothetical protein